MGAFFGIRPIVGTFTALLLVAWFAATAQAATYTVGTTADNTGTCVPTSGTCSLRQLIDYEDALTSTPSPADVIAVPPGSYNLTNGPLVIDQSLTIEGGGARDTNIYQETTSQTSRVFDIQLNSQLALTPTVTIADLATFFGAADSTNQFFGGDIRNRGNLTLDSDLIANGTTSAGSGGGISNDGGTLTVTHSLVENNDSEVTNGAGGDSGGIQNYGDSSVGSGVLTVIDSTVADNTSALGGGIYSWCNGACSNTTTVIASTIANNNGGDRGTTGGGLLASEGTISVGDSIVAGNFVTNANDVESASNCGSSSPGAITSLGYNIDSGSDCGFGATGDEQNTSPGFLDGLADNGGQTDTFALTAASPAVDAILTGNVGCTGMDQRGIVRPQGTGCDIGAFELFQPEEGHQFTAVLGSVGATTATINWGDGTPTSAASIAPSTGQVTGTHTYASAGDFAGTISWRNSDNTPQTTPFDLKVQYAPVVTDSVVVTPAGQAFSGTVATFTDANPNRTAADYSATINWGDGTVSAGTVTAGTGNFIVSGSHMYASPGTYQTIVAIDEVGGATASSMGTAMATGAPAPVTTGAPAVTGPNGAAFSGSVNPDGLATTAYFQYGIPPNAQGPEGAGPTFTQFTPTQAIGSDFSNHAVSASVSGLVPNELYDVQLVATNSAGTTYGPIETFTTALNEPPPPPVLGKQVNVTLVSGHVWIKPPPGKSLGPAGDRGALSKGQGFVPLTEARQVPTGSEVDALHGSLRIVSNTGKVGKTQTATLAGGVFNVGQIRKGISKGLTTFNLVESAFQGAPTYTTCKPKYKKAGDATIASLSSKTLQLLKVSGHGKFKTTGRYASATVRGTIYTVADRCDGTLTHVIRDTVLVDDFVRHKTILLHAGQSYLAKKP